MKKLATKVQILSRKINPLEHLLSKKHTRKHRMLVGLIIGLSGVIIAEICGEIHQLKVPGETFGSFLHALGATPYLDRLVEMFNSPENN